MLDEHAKRGNVVAQVCRLIFYTNAKRSRPNDLEFSDISNRWAQPAG